MKWLAAIVVMALLASAFVAGGHQEKEQVYAGYITQLEGRSSAQRHNATLCSNKLSGTEIMPGEVFSFNEVVGPWSRDQGYRRAPVSYGGQLVDAWGGGVCQTSTTIYNAALLAGFEIVERNPHHYAPSYVTPGRDAAVAFPNIDLKFRNTLDVPVTLILSQQNGKLRAEFRARTLKKPSAHVWQTNLQTIKPMTLNISSEGKTWVRNPGKPGYEVETWREIDGVRKRMSRDSYPVMNRVIDGESYR
ncbi:MAG: VanW family protein [Fimbriimonadaceae bacterium]|nr:MAG: VanW family protein [Fimbriimonadaceae bacterium]